MFCETRLLIQFLKYVTILVHSELYSTHKHPHTLCYLVLTHFIFLRLSQRDDVTFIQIYSNTCITILLQCKTLNIFNKFCVATLMQHWIQHKKSYTTVRFWQVIQSYSCPGFSCHNNCFNDCSLYTFPCSCGASVMDHMSGL